MRSVAQLLGAGWGALLVAGMWPRRPLPVRSRGGRRRLEGRRRPRRGPADRVGRAVLRLSARARRPGAEALPIDPTRLGRALLSAISVVVVSPLVAVAVGVLVWALPVLGQHRAHRARERAIRGDLPEVVDLLALAVSAGLTVPLALDAVARRAAGPVGEALGSTTAEVRAGRRLVDALGALPHRLGEEARPLTVALVASVRDGSPLGDGLDRLAGELRVTRRRQAEEAARRVPIKLLFPLVCCILPAFALLTVAPLLAGALRSLRL